VTVHIYRYTCPSADWDGVHEPTPERRLFWSMRSLASAYLTMVKACPAVARRQTRMLLHIDPTAFTVQYRPVALRTLLTSCHCCPDDAADPADVSGSPVFQQLPDAPDGTERWTWTCPRPGCGMTGLHDRNRWAIEAVTLHNLATDHNALAAACNPDAAVAVPSVSTYEGASCDDHA
jgi:hypothetical protein